MSLEASSALDSPLRPETDPESDEDREDGSDRAVANPADTPKKAAAGTQTQWILILLTGATLDASGSSYRTWL
jgi:hypothetical protein